MISPGGPVNLGASTSGTSGKGPRVHWSEAETWSLIRLWEDNIGELRRQRRNAGVYETIRLGLERLSIDKTRKQVSDKIDNLNQTYRTKKKNQTTGSGKVTWPYFYDLHRFLGGLPVNDPSLVDDSLPGDALQEPEDISPEESQETVDPPEELAVEPQQKKKKKSSCKQADLVMLVLEEQRAQRQELREARERTHRDRQRQFAIMQESNDLQREFLQFLKSKAQK
ncbi:myb/SANT-like DNA-binding domain-containing protein 1 isoform X1 [Ixodes scapularis]|uniref:myb/SANT-like DNA-binding domain-containing protein 1 isoform X1 n=1 Tax=Ixodes scapularis TaxID=6945 RepID=UPI001A9D2C0E|nr:myb/SANT-like DNA-binding domain-containing protein 1 isoform X1 [Ixodes scapularis]